MFRAAKWGMRHATGHAWETSMCTAGQPERPVATHIFSSQPACNIMLSSCRQRKKVSCTEPAHRLAAGITCHLQTLLSLEKCIQSVSTLVSCLYCKPKYRLAPTVPAVVLLSAGTTSLALNNPVPVIYHLRC